MMRDRREETRIEGVWRDRTLVTGNGRQVTGIRVLFWGKRQRVAGGRGLPLLRFFLFRLQLLIACLFFEAVEPLQSFLRLVWEELPQKSAGRVCPGSHQDLVLLCCPRQQIPSDSWEVFEELFWRWLPAPKPRGLVGACS